MRSHTARLRESQANEPRRSRYTSHALRLFTEHLENQTDAQLLDVGPVCGENLEFFARRVKRVFVCDMFLRLDLARRKERTQNQAWQDLDYPPNSFDGITLWALFDYLDDQGISALVARCSYMIRPSGILLAVVQDEHHIVDPGIQSYVIAEDFDVFRRPQPHLSLPSQRRHNRALLGMVEPFIPLKSFIYRGGIKELLLQHK
ncbi:MAG: class I SAM-dependent methyltransferase [Deltaproteobacteria bacterium]|nr:class I SAM-dependent methyltransferase [Deltaproteobacteria bacterium]